MLSVALLLFKRFWPYLAALAVLAGAWIAWQRHSTARYEAGQAEVMGRWQEADRIAVAAGNEITGLLKRANAANTGALNEKLTVVEQKAAARAVGMADALADADELFAQLQAARSSPAAGSADSCTAARGNEADLGICRGLLADGVKVASDCRRLAEQGENLAAIAEVRLTSMQDWARLVLSANEAP